MSIVKTNRISAFATFFMLLVGCSEKSITIGDLYLEAWTALEAYKHGKYTYIPASKEITVTAIMDGNQFKVSAIGFVQNRKMALRLTYPKVCLSKKDTCLLGANKELDALRKCVDKAISGTPATGSCSVSSMIINGDKGSIVSDQLNAPHIDVWVKM